MSEDKLHPAADAVIRKFVLNLWAFERDVYDLQQEYPNKFSYPIWDTENNCEYTAERTPNQEVGDIYSEVIPLTDQLLTLLGFDNIEALEESMVAEAEAAS